MKKILVTLFAILALYLSGCNNNNSSSAGDPKTVLTNFFDAMAKKDITAARNLATTDSKPIFDMLEMGMQMKDNTIEEKPDEQFDKSKMKMSEAKIEGDKATVNVKELQNGESINFVLKKEAGAWKVAMDINTMMGIGAEKIKEKVINEMEMGNFKDQMKKIESMSTDSLKMIMNKGMKALDSINKNFKK